KLSAPAHAFLISFRPDGTDEVLFPEDEKQPPGPTDQPRYPSVSRGTAVGLDEGTGLQVIALAASRRPLPGCAEWRKGLGASPWGWVEAAENVVWQDDGSSLLQLTPTNPRGKGKELAGGGPLSQLTAWLKRAPGVEAVTAVGFPVLRAD